MTEGNKYQLKAKILTHKYEDIVKDFEQFNDDRLLVVNLYHMLMEACKAMESMENNYVCVAFNTRFKDEDALMEQIVTRFNDTKYNGHKWEPLNSPVFKVYRHEHTKNGEKEILVKTTMIAEEAFNLAVEFENCGIDVHISKHQMDGSDSRVYY